MLSHAPRRPAASAARSHWRPRPRAYSWGRDVAGGGPEALRTQLWQPQARVAQSAERTTLIVWSWVRAPPRVPRGHQPQALARRSCHGFCCRRPRTAACRWSNRARHAVAHRSSQTQQTAASLCASAHHGSGKVTRTLYTLQPSVQCPGHGNCTQLQRMCVTAGATVPSSCALEGLSMLARHRLSTSVVFCSGCRATACTHAVAVFCSAIWRFLRLVQGFTETMPRAMHLAARVNASVRGITCPMQRQRVQSSIRALSYSLSACLHATPGCCMTCVTSRTIHAQTLHPRCVTGASGSYGAPD